MFSFSCTKNPTRVFLMKWLLRIASSKWWLKRSRLFSPNSCVTLWDLRERWDPAATCGNLCTSQPVNELGAGGGAGLRFWPHPRREELHSHFHFIGPDRSHGLIGCKGPVKCSLAVFLEEKGNHLESGSVKWSCHMQAGLLRANERNSWNCSFLKLLGKRFCGRCSWEGEEVS